jgi:monofunctional biosynthetic peptidoglycan transglycosylase
VARRRSLPARLFRTLGIVALGLVAACVLVVLLLRWVPVPLTSFMLQDRIAALRSGGKDHSFEHDWVAWEEISPNAAVAVVAAEDQKFAYHLGFDVESIDRAMKEAKRGRRLRGASTISQQVAKNLFLWPGQSWVRKGFEAWFTLLIEALWPKQRILEVYLNSAEFGRGVWGVEAASAARGRAAQPQALSRGCAVRLREATAGLDPRADVGAGRLRVPGRARGPGGFVAQVTVPATRRIRKEEAPALAHRGLFGQGLVRIRS